MMKRSSSETISRGEKAVIGGWYSSVGVKRLDGDLRVGVDADVGGDRHRFPGDGLSVQVGVGQGAGGGGGRVLPAGADAHDAALGFEPIAGPGRPQELRGLADGPHGLEAAKVAV